MASFSKLGIILCSVFGVILLGLVAELYYYFWWKKKSNKNTEQKKHSNWLLLSFLFWRKNPVSAVNNYSTEEVSSTVEANGHGNGHEQEKQEDLEAGNGNGNGRDTLLKELVEEGVESELFRLHNLCGPPRFLFTIKEETKEELMEDQSEDVSFNGSLKGSRSRKSLNDLIIATDFDATFNPIEKMAPLESLNHNGFNPLFESMTDNKQQQQQQQSSIILSKDSDSDSESEFNKLRSSPPPKFKFMRDAEEKLIKRLVEEAKKKGCFQDSPVVEEEKDGSFIAFLNLNKGREKGIQEQHHVSSIQNKGLGKVLPLATSPPKRSHQNL